VAFSESDSYFSFAYVVGQDVSAKAWIPTNAAPVNGVVNYKWHAGLLNQSWLDGVAKHRVYVTTAAQTVDAVYAWGGDLDWSHSSAPDAIAASIAAGNYTNSANSLKTNEIKTMAMTSNIE